MVAVADLTGRRPGLAGEPLVRLAELRRRQGRTDEAAELFAQAEGHPRALLGLAALALDLGNPDRCGGAGAPVRPAVSGQRSDFP